MRQKTLLQKLWVYTVLTGVCCCAAALVGCQEKKKKADVPKVVKVITVKLQTPIKRLYFTGTLEPISVKSVTSPVAGHIAKLAFAYGEKVEKGQDLVVLDSDALATSFRKAVSDYLQKKDTYDNSKESYAGSKALYQAKINSREQYLSDRSTYENNVLNFFQSRYQLRKVLKQADVSFDEISKLNLSEIRQVMLLLRKKFNNIIIKAPADGVALFPVAGEQASSDSSKTGKLQVGDDVKEGQLLLSIGDLTGFAARVQVSEVDVNKITPQMDVRITGDAFPQFTLKGVVKEVASQANPSSAGGGGSLSMFKVLVVVPSITKAEKKIIHVGMTAKIEVDIKGTPGIMVPIKAVFHKNGKSYVTVVNKANQHTSVLVTTGQTTPVSVLITSGIKMGDRVAVYDRVR